jgi:hypothetical protein
MKKLFSKYFIPLTGYSIEKRDNVIYVYRNSVRYGIVIQKLISVCDDDIELNKVLSLIGVKKKE